MANVLAVSQLVADEALLEFSDMTPMISMGGKLPDKQFKETMYAPGLTVSVPKQNILLAGEGLTATDQYLQEESVPVTVGQLINVMIPFNSLEELLEVGSPTLKLSTGWKIRVLIPAMQALRAKLEARVVNQMLLSYYMSTGTVGTPINGLASFANARVLTDLMEIQADELVSFINQYSYATVSTGVSNVFNQQFNNPILRDLNLARLGDYGLAKSNYISQTNYGDAAVGNSVTVKTSSTEGDATIVLTGITSGSTLKAGARFRISTGSDYIKYVTPNGKVTTQSPIDFVVQADATKSGSDITVTVASGSNGALIRGTPGQPRQVMSRLPAAGDVVHFLCDGTTGNATNTYCVNPMGSYSLIGLRLPQLEGAANSASVDDVSQMAVRTVVQGAIQTSVNRFRVDIAPIVACYADYGNVIIS